MFILKCLDWNNRSQFAACRPRWRTSVANTSTHDGYGSVNITELICVCDSRRSPLSGVKYDPLFHFRHDGRDRTVTVGHEIKLVSLYMVDGKALYHVLVLLCSARWRHGTVTNSILRIMEFRCSTSLYVLICEYLSNRLLSWHNSNAPAMLFQCWISFQLKL